MTENAQGHPWSTRSIIISIVLPLIVGLAIALFIPQPLIGLIYLDNAIDSVSANEIISQMRYARENSRIKAVILVVNTPGGTVADSESVYFEANQLRQSMPVITLIESMAASGGYYLASGTDYIFAKPGSIVGNIGVIGYVPETPSLIEGIYSTGPYKMWSEPRDRFIRELEIQKEGFYEAVRMGRGDALTLNKEEVLSGQIWLGSEAVKNGIVDELGSISQAIQKVGQMAHITHYEVVDLRELTGIQPADQGTSFFQHTAEGNNNGYPQQPGLYMLYIPSMEVQP